MEPRASRRFWCWLRCRVRGCRRLWRRRTRWLYERRENGELGTDPTVSDTLIKEIHMTMHLQRALSKP